MLIAVSLAVAYAGVTGGALRSHTPAFAAPVTGLSLPGVSSSVPVVDETVLRPLAINKTLRVVEPAPPEQQQVAQQLQALAATPTPMPTPSQDAVVRAASVAPPPDLPPYQVYTVRAGDTISSIAAQFGIHPEYIVANNAEIQDANFLVLGQSLLIPAGDGILHEVKYGETLSDIASQYSVDISAITGFAANHITRPDNITETELIYVPGAVIPAPAAAPVSAPAPSAAPTPGSGGGSVTAPPPAAHGPRSGKGLIWPVRGPISSCYCPWHPLGIDIDGYNLAGAPIAAATDGTVIFAGGNACCSYGLYVVVMSPGGIQTLYGHLSSIAVTQGQHVAQGATLGIIGSTGYSTGRHLHFEVIDNGVRENPLDYLPGPVNCEPGQCQ
ncbi:MAG TPA: M23 family metallopeptidase [Dehalococcoidia bacterium]|nr:M23 family metallopeptidase [Dehalococcoidia bacterium]